MYETNIVVVGNVLTAPEWRRTTSSGFLVANFRVASTVRRYDRENRRWVDGDSLRVRVTAWRKLAEGVASSIAVGDPVIVYGRIYTRDWVDDDKKTRISYEMEAISIGHDLNRGRGRFYRTKSGASSVIEGPDEEAMVRGEQSEPVAEDEKPVAYGEGLPEGLPEESAPGFRDTVPLIVREDTEKDDDEAGAGEPGPAEEKPVPAPTPDDVRRSRRAHRREPVPA